MRWAVGQYRDLEEWHQWFAWNPVKVDLLAGNEWVWLEFVIRREQTSSSGQEHWEYR